MVDDGSGGRLPSAGQPADPSMPSRVNDGDNNPASQSSKNPYYDFHHQGPTPQQQVSGAHPFGTPGQHASYQRAHRQSPGAFNMGGMAGALPEYHHSSPSQISPYDHQNYPGAAQQFPGQANAGGYPVHPHQYSTPFQSAGAAAQGYGLMQGGRGTHSGGPSPIHSTFPSSYFPTPQQQYMHYGAQFAQMGQVPYPTAFSPASHQGYGRGDMSAIGGRPPYSGLSPGGSVQYSYVQSGQYLRPGPAPVGSRESSGSSGNSLLSTPRGPPRKPKQSGYALWVGNLPSGTIVGDLKDHFSRDATKDIESVFLISKSNCAFVNYRTETACAAAMTRFHDSRFQGVRLVCRLRRSPASNLAPPGLPTAPAALMPSTAQNQTALDAITQNREVSSKAVDKAAAEQSHSGETAVKVADKYFVMKSLTVEDMELSVRNKTWATQAHNEDALNRAYETTEAVYLIFSANKSGEYFGFARMASPINEESSASLEWAPRGETIPNDPDVPRSIPTPATESAPPGRIIDDSARGTIFWEADHEEEELAVIGDQDNDNVEGTEETVKGATEEEDRDEVGPPGDPQAFGRPFKIEWLATNRLPFYRTRGLRNPWNANREVKIARDGTELETSVGRRLVQMFPRSPVDPGPQASMGYAPPRPY